MSSEEYPLVEMEGAEVAVVTEVTEVTEVTGATGAVTSGRSCGAGPGRVGNGRGEGPLPSTGPLGPFSEA